MGRAPSARSLEVEDLLRQHCEDNNVPIKVFLRPGRGAAFVQEEIKELEKYTQAEINNSLRRIKETFDTTTPKKSSTTSNNMKENNNNNYHDTDSPMNESPDLAYRRGSPVESPRQDQECKRSPKRGRSEFGQYSPTPIQRQSTQRDRPGTDSTRKIVKAARIKTDPRNLCDKFDNLAFSEATRNAPAIIFHSRLPDRVLESITNKETFTEHARRVAMGGEVVEQVNEIARNEHSLANLKTEAELEENVRNAIIENDDSEIECVTEELERLERDYNSRRGELSSKLDGLKKRKERHLIDNRLVLSQVLALYNLGIHACSTLKKCANFRLKQGEEVKGEATKLAEEHISMQKSYKIGGVEEYEKLAKLQSSVEGSIFYT